MKIIKQLTACLLMAILSIGQVCADSYTIGWGNAAGAEGTYTNFTATSGSVPDIVSFSTDKGSSSTEPSYNASNKELRLSYNSKGDGGYILLKPASGLTITGFTMTTSTAPTVKYSADEGAAVSIYADNNRYIVSGISASSSLKIQNGNTTSTQLRIKAILITYTTSSGESSNPTGTFIKFTGDLVEGDYVFVVSDEAMTNTISNNRLTNTGVTTASNTITNPDGAIVWHIAASGDYWTIYNAEAEKYAASTGVENQVQLLADGTDDKAKWSVTVNGEKYQFLNKANAANNVNAKLEHYEGNGWACYSAYSSISLYKKVLPEETIRSVEPGTWGTICPEKEVLQPSGASFYTIDYVEMQDGTPSRVFFSEIGETESLRAGHPYVFVAEEDAIKGAQTGAAATEGFNDHGFIGCIDDYKFHVYDEDTRDKYYVIYQNQIMRCTDGWFLLKAGGAYLDMKDPTLRTEGSAAPAPGRRRLTLTNPEAAPQVATDLNTITDSNKPVKVIINNRMFILRDGRLYDATGRLVKEQD